MTSPIDLPINECLPQILEAARAGQSIVLTAPPGAGKTTAVPLAFLEDRSVSGDGQILLAQPRRLAARSAAARLAKLAGTELGDLVGYHVRFDRQASKRTRFLVVTYGILLRRLQSDPFLEDVRSVLLDEFHERTLEADLSLGMLSRIRNHFRSDLQLTVMSATLSARSLVNYLPDAVAIQSEGRMFPVEIEYRPPLERQHLTQFAASLVPEVLSRTRGHVLIFFPGVGEIQAARRTLLQSLSDSNIELLPLYADLPLAEQDRVLEPSSRRKVILATNVAETSITIDNVTSVIDTGQARVLRFEPKIGLPRLRLEPISQASADQRAGRAGRTASGLCLRLWAKASHASRPAYDTPEVLRSDLAPAVLTLASWGENSVTNFPWIDPPPPPSIDQAKGLLRSLHAIDREDTITDSGQLMAEIPAHPRLAQLLLVAADHGVLKQASIAAALLTERDPFQSAGSHEPSNPPAPRRSQEITELVERVENESNRNRRLKPLLRVASQMAKLVEQKEARQPGDADESLRRALLAAFSDRVARRRQPDANTGLMTGGKGVQLDAWRFSTTSELVLCLKVDAGKSNARVDVWCPIDRDWLEAKAIRVLDEPVFNEATQSIVGRRRERYQDLILSEIPIAIKPSSASARLLVDRAEQLWQAPYPPSRDDVGAFLTRVRLIRQHLGDDSLPPLESDQVREVAMQLANKVLSIPDLESADWLSTFRNEWTYEQSRLLEAEAPSRLLLPSGNSTLVHYVEGKLPAIHARIQELYGWLETPRIVRKRVPLQLHLQGPNYRTEQITDDLGRFWEATYPVVRKDLRGRYPKHHWPEDPTTAVPTRNGLKPRS